MEPFANVLEIVCPGNAGSGYESDNEWVGHPADYHLGRAEEHLRLCRDGDQLQDHISHAGTRLLMALTLRELD